MKHLIAIVLSAGWYFIAYNGRAEHPKDFAQIGPFATEAACFDHMMWVQDHGGITTKKCWEA